MLASIVIRTYNEEKHLPELLEAVAKQKSDGCSIETVVVDSGSTDRTLEIAKDHDCRITHIKKEEFTFGRSLNIGCEFADGDFLLMISGHCIPTNEKWVERLVTPLIDETIAYSYGRQIGRDTTKYSEKQVFEKYFPQNSAVPQEGFFCNNANAAVRRDAWQHLKFDENLTGLEDMALAQRLVEGGLKVAYVADAAVYHIHDETWAQVRHRYEREAIALQNIFPNVHINFVDFIRYVIAGILNDSARAISDRTFLKYFREIVMFRLCQYWGSYKGNHLTRKISKQTRDRYFYPK